MFRKITAIIVVFMFCFATLVSAQSVSQLTIMDKLAVLENSVYGTAQTGAIMERVSGLEVDFYGAKTNKSIVEKVDALYDSIFVIVNGQPSALARLNAIEWSITHSVTGTPIKERVDNLENMLNGHVKAGSLQDRITTLANIAFPSGEIALQEAVIPADTLIKISIITPLDSKNSVVGEKVEYQAAEDIIIGGTLVVPKGSKGMGTISKVERAQNFGRDAKLEVSFDSISTIDGDQLAVILGDKAKQEMEHMALAAGASIAGMALLGPVGIVTGVFVKGKDIKIPVGSEMYLQTKAEQSIAGIQVGNTSVAMNN